ncbi:hypothetical protein RHGRI_001679 [Rhododendron griersonianum]|uniref:CCHC-type domain-containing protein n=1 Tax=Rhododendron griersonianum TaxID=479676 RepID=A0AAV6LNP2_9ERIC|nr:hypothetical protein RHGRI_001679 [Rhododendron griersonianum]
MPPAYFELIINHKGKVARLPNIDPDKYRYFDLVADVSEKLLSHYPPGLGIAISIFCELPGTGYRIDLDSDKSLVDMFNLDGVPSTLNLFVEVESPNLCQVEHPSVVDVEDVEAVDATQDGHEVESDDGGRLIYEISGVDDEGLSDYQSSDDEGNMSSGSDEVTKHGAGAKLRDYTVEKGFKIVRDKNEKARDKKNVEDFVHSYYSKEMYLRAHGSMIHPILDHSMWTIVPGDPLDPPPLRRSSGRPRKAKKRAADEPAAGTSQSKRSPTIKCMRCKEFGHNKRTCQGGPVRGIGGPTNRDRGNNGRSRFCKWQ